MFFDESVLMKVILLTRCSVCWFGVEEGFGAVSDSLAVSEFRVFGTWAAFLSGTAILNL